MKAYTLGELRERADGKKPHHSWTQAYWRALVAVRAEMTRLPAWRKGVEDSIVEHCANANGLRFNWRGILTEPFNLVEPSEDCRIGRLAELLIVSDAEYQTDNPVRAGIIEASGYEVVGVVGGVLCGWWKDLNYAPKPLDEEEERACWELLASHCMTHLDRLDIEPVRYCPTCPYQVDVGWRSCEGAQCWRCCAMQTA